MMMMMIMMTMVPVMVVMMMLMTILIIGFWIVYSIKVHNKIYTSHFMDKPKAVIVYL